MGWPQVGDFEVAIRATCAYFIGIINVMHNLKSGEVLRKRLPTAFPAIMSRDMNLSLRLIFVSRFRHVEQRERLRPILEFFSFSTK